MISCWTRTQIHRLIICYGQALSLQVSFLFLKSSMTSGGGTIPSPRFSFAYILNLNEKQVSIYSYSLAQSFASCGSSTTLLTWGSWLSLLFGSCSRQVVVDISYPKQFQTRPLAQPSHVCHYVKLKNIRKKPQIFNFQWWKSFGHQIKIKNSSQIFLTYWKNQALKSDSSIFLLLPLKKRTCLKLLYSYFFLSSA